MKKIRSSLTKYTNRKGDELESDKSKKQKVDDYVEAEEDNDQKEAELKKHMGIVKDDKIAIDAIPLATKPPMIVEYKIFKEGKMRYFQLIRADGSSKRGGLLGLKDFKMILRVTAAQSKVSTAGESTYYCLCSVSAGEKITTAVKG
ncbi:hypothetical protein Tco_1058864 [Tanacetum coccineum]